jgi:O-antigen/teichoic acid export membrane protein
MPENISEKTKLGIIYNAAARALGGLMQVIGTIVLARLLAPEDFGIVAVGMLIIGLASRFGEFGFSAGLIQRKGSITEKHINTLFFLDVSFKTVLWVIFYLATPYLVRIFQDTRLITVIPVISLYMVLECLSTTPLTVLKREMNFKRYSLVITIEDLIILITSIILAWFGCGFWSLIYAKLVGAIGGAVLAAKLAHWRPKPLYDHQACKELFGFGVMVFLRSLLRYATDNVDYLFVSIYLGTTQLGLYEKAFEIMKMPQQRLTRALNTVVYSAFSRIQDEPERVRMAFRKLVLTISLVSYPLLGGLAFISPLLMPLALGDSWRAIVAPVQILCIAGVLRSIDPFLNSVLTATGFVKTTVFRRLIEFFLMTIATLIGVRYGITGVSIAIVLVSFITMIFMIGFLSSVSRVRWRDYFSPQVPAIVTSTGMLIMIYVISLSIERIYEMSEIFFMICQIITGCISYIALHILFRFREVMSLIGEVIGDFKQLQGRIKGKGESANSRGNIPLVGV